MVRFRYFLALLFCAFSLNAADLKNDLVALAPTNAEQINAILENSANFLDARGNVNYASLCAHLRSLGLLAITSGADLKLGFESSPENSILMIRSVSSALKNMGYKFFLTSWFENNPAIWRVSLSSRASLDPGILYTEFSKQNIFIKKIKRDSDNSFIYELDLDSVVIKTDELLETPIRPKNAYFLNVSGKRMINISANIDDTWQPFIRVFDKKLHLIKTEQIKNKMENLRLELPAGAAYALIDDLYSLENIKHGLTISLQ